MNWKNKQERADSTLKYSLNHRKDIFGEKNSRQIYLMNLSGILQAADLI
jgi:hypothetical protein